MPSWAKLIHVKKSPVASTRRYHHIGIPTTERREGERLIEHYATFVSGYETSAYGIEWMRFEPEAPVPELVRTVPHVAFEVDDLSAEIAGKCGCRIASPPEAARRTVERPQSRPQIGTLTYITIEPQRAYKQFLAQQ